MNSSAGHSDRVFDFRVYLHPVLGFVFSEVSGLSYKGRFPFSERTETSA